MKQQGSVTEKVFFRYAAVFKGKPEFELEAAVRKGHAHGQRRQGGFWIMEGFLNKRKLRIEAVLWGKRKEKAKLPADKTAEKCYCLDKPGFPAGIRTVDSQGL